MRERPAENPFLTRDDAGFLQRLRGLIGRECEYLGRQCRLIEVLAEEAALVLEAREYLPPIQTDQYGQASYRANDLIQVPLYGETRELFSQELLDLFACLTASRKTDATSESA